MCQNKKQKKHKPSRKRAGIEPIIGHLKADHRLCRNFYAEVFGDQCLLRHCSISCKSTFDSFLGLLGIFFLISENCCASIAT